MKTSHVEELLGSSSNYYSQNAFIIKFQNILKRNYISYSKLCSKLSCCIQNIQNLEEIYHCIQRNSPRQGNGLISFTNNIN